MWRRGGERHRFLRARDFNGDGKTDLAITGVAGWNTLPTALSIGSGAFTYTNTNVGDFAIKTSTSGATIL